MTSRRVRLAATSAGPARVTTLGPPSQTVLVLGHGAGGGTDAIDLAAISARVTNSGLRVVLVDQPWRVAGRRVAPRPEALDIAWLEVVGRLRISRLVVGGRSAGARVACRTAGALGAVGVVALAFPLHPPGRPEVSRGAELAQVDVPALVVQGERDAFGTPRQVRAAARKARVLTVPGADHSMRVKSQALVKAGDAVADFLHGLP